MRAAFGLLAVVLAVVLAVALATAPAWAQPVAPPHMLGGILPDWFVAAIGGFFVGGIPLMICLKIAEALKRRWYDSRIATALSLAIGLFGFFSWGYVIYFFVWVV